MGSLKKLYGYYKAGDKWIPILVSVSGKVVISAIPDHHLLHEIGGSDEIEGLSDITPDRITIASKARAYLNTRQTNITDATLTKVLLDTENYDIGSNFDHVTNNRFTVTIPGYYLLTGNIDFTNAIANKRFFAILYKNGNTLLADNWAHSSIATTVGVNVIDIQHLEEGDFIELYVYLDTGVNTTNIMNGSHLTFMAIHLLSV